MSEVIERELEKARKEYFKGFTNFMKVLKKTRALELGCVYREQRDNQLKVAPSNYKLTPGNVEYILEMFDGTSSGINALAFQFRVSGSTIRYHLRKHGLTKKGKRLPRK